MLLGEVILMLLLVILWFLIFTILIKIVVIIVEIIANAKSVNAAPKKKRHRKNAKLDSYQTEDAIPSLTQSNSDDSYCRHNCSQNNFEPQDQTHHPKTRQSLEQNKIVITGKSEYKPSLLDTPFQFSGKTPNPQDATRHYLILEKRALTKLRDSLDWDSITTRNQVEQAGVLLGRAAIWGNEIYCFVEDILMAETFGNPVFVEITYEIWADLYNKLSELKNILDKNAPLVIVGWFHTHPNDLSVFMSATDMITQRQNFSQEWQASLVMNPHTNKYRAFFGARATEGKVVLPESQIIQKSEKRGNLR